ncbi:MULTISPECIES: PqqD family peptide modification chaperone [unclassified Rathayibacter]|uniref:PqqD family peptide modification chaperone n=1 Tax=unclassified Rathayibacter TaxID=2609250 RepID=UPI0011AFFF82|nr:MULTISPECIES: PqqD family peptide modification chaperone [unclassified Rathayibacter]
MSPEPVPAVGASADAMLPNAVALRLAAVLVQYTLRTHGVRNLVVKGEGLHRQGIRAPMTSADVDLWVDPERFDEALGLLASMGWRRRAEALSWTLFVDHSITLVHPSWPCDVDVHRSFPGAFEEERIVFDRLWAAAEDLPLSDETLRIPGRAHHLVLHALHQLRSARSASATTALAVLKAHAAGLPSEEREAIRDAAVELGAQTPMTELLTSWGVPAAPEERYRQAQILWDVRRSSDRHTFNWLHAVASAPWHLKGGLLLRAAFPTRADLEASHPEATTVRRRLRLRGERTLRALRGLPSALTGFARVALSGRSEEQGSASSFEAIAATTAPVSDLPASSDPAASAVHPVEASAEAQGGSAPPAQRFAVERTDRQVYVLDLSRPSVSPIVLSLSAASVFEAVIRQRRPRDEVVDLLADHYDVDPGTMGRDVDAVLAELDVRFPGAVPDGALS